MAGAGYKLFNTGDVLTAAQVNTYLMEQTVMVFASSTARTTALSGVLAEGMMSYLQDTNAVQVYNGSAWVNVGEAGDITEVIAGTGISGGGTSGAVTVTNSMATAINAKGDLIAGTADNAFDRLAAGSNGDTLVADSSTSTGLRYNPQNALANPVINGGMDIWQRGTSFTIGTSTNTYAADRWQASRAGTAGLTVSRQTTSDTTNLPNIQYSLRMQRDSGNTSTANLNLWTNIETINSIPFAGRTVTLSFYARAGANYSTASNQLQVNLYTGTGTDQNVNISGFTGSATPISQTPALTTSWQRFSYTATLATTTTEIAILFVNTPVGTAGANDWYEITGIQIDLGTYTASSAPTFRRTGGNIAGELAACQRYYWRPFTNKAYGSYGYLKAYSTTAGRALINLPVAMRVIPTSVEYSSLRFSDWAVAGYTITALTLVSDECTNQLAGIEATVSSGLTAQRVYALANDNNTAGYLAFSAEL